MFGFEALDSHAATIESCTIRAKLNSRDCQGTGFRDRDSRCPWAWELNLHEILGKILSNLTAGLKDSKELVELPKLLLGYMNLYQGCVSEIVRAIKTKQAIQGEDDAGNSIAIH